MSIPSERAGCLRVLSMFVIYTIVIPIIWLIEIVSGTFKSKP